MKIFVTGSTGFIGKNAVAFYRSQNFEVFEFRRHMDLSKELDQFNPNLIINCAAEIYNKDQMFETNVGLVEKCLRWV